MTIPEYLAEPLVSIVLATNRNSPFLDATLKSVSGQTWQRWELIIVDDGGPNPSALDEIAKTLPNCRVVHRPPGGLAMARNAGIAASQGELLVFLDDDDVWHPDRLRRQVAELSRDPDAVACYSSGRYIDAAGAEIPGAWPQTGVTREQLLSGAMGLPRIVTMMVRREPCIAVGCFNPAIYLKEDDEFILRLLRYGRFTCSPDVLVDYRRHDNNESSAPLVNRGVWGYRALLLQLWAAEARANHDDLRLTRRNIRTFRRSNADAWLSSALVSAKSAHALRAFDELTRAFGWSAPRAATVTVTKLGRSVLKPGRRRVRQPEA